MNENISGYLDFYTDPANPVSGAVLISGKWGAGKTHLIKENYLHEKPPNKFIYISLYGISSILEIENEIFTALFPRLSSDNVQLLGKLTGLLSKVVIKYDVIDGETNASRDDGQIELAQQSGLSSHIKQMLLDTSDKIIVFDDLERCQLDTDVIFGYFSRLLGEKCRLVIIANEEEIRSNNDEDYYRKVKEKIINKTFVVKTDFQQAIQGFEKRFFHESNCFNINYSHVIQKVYELSGSMNLRTVLSIYESMHWILSQIGELKSRIVGSDLNKYDVQFFELFLMEFSAFTFQINLGDLVPEDVKSIWKAVSVVNFDTQRQRPSQEKHSNIIQAATKLRDKYGSILRPYSILNDDFWAEIFETNQIDRVKFQGAIDSYKKSYDEEEDWYKLVKIRNLTDDEFKEINSTVRSSIQSGGENRLGVIFHYYGLRYSLSKKGLCRTRPNIWLSEMESQVLKRIQENTIRLPRGNDSLLQLDRDFGDTAGHYNLLYWSSGFTEFTDKTIELCRTINLKILKREIQDELVVFETDPFDLDTFESIMCPTNFNNQSFKSPVLNIIGSDKLSDILEGLEPPSNIVRFCRILERRYERALHEHFGELHLEKDQIESVKRWIEDLSRDPNNEMPKKLAAYEAIPHINKCVALVARDA